MCIYYYDFGVIAIGKLLQYRSNFLCNFYIENGVILCYTTAKHLYGKGVSFVPMKYKIDILAALKEKGYNTNRLRQEDLLAETVIHSLRHNKPVSWKNIEKLCVLLECQPGDILILEGGQTSEE